MSPRTARRFNVPSRTCSDAAILEIDDVEHPRVTERADIERLTAGRRVKRRHVQRHGRTAIHSIASTTVASNDVRYASV